MIERKEDRNLMAALARVAELTKRLDGLEQEMKDIEALRREIINKYDLNKD